MSKKVRVRYLTTARGPDYRHDEGQVAEVDLREARRLIANEHAVALDPDQLVEEPVSEPKTEESEVERQPETAERRPAETATAPPQRRVGTSRRPAEHSERPPKS